jgi:hypothetical protein
MSLNKAAHEIRPESYLLSFDKKLPTRTRTVAGLVRTTSDEREDVANFHSGVDRIFTRWGLITWRKTLTNVFRFSQCRLNSLSMFALLTSHHLNIFCVFKPLFFHHSHRWISVPVNGANTALCFANPRRLYVTSELQIMLLVGRDSHFFF